jgi:3'-5' exoribonuclease
MIKDFVIGEQIQAFLLMKRIEVKVSANGSRLTLVLGDRTGNIDAVVWNDAEMVRDSLDDTEVVKVQGLVSSYHNKPQLTVERIRTANIGEYDPEDLKRAAGKPPEELKAELVEIIDSITDIHLNKLLQLILENEVVFSKYLQSPAGKMFHHDFISGLAEHSLSMARLADLVCQNYSILNRDLLVTGAILHDIGKITEFEGEIVYDYSDAGRLIGHISIGDHLIADLIREIEDFPCELENKLRHLILSHHGSLDKGAVVKPKTREAFVLHCLDEIDSKLDAINKIAEKTDGNWSEYIKPLEDFLYFG